MGVGDMLKVGPVWSTQPLFYSGLGLQCTSIDGVNLIHSSLYSGKMYCKYVRDLKWIQRLWVHVFDNHKPCLKPVIAWLDIG